VTARANFVTEGAFNRESQLRETSVAATVVADMLRYLEPEGVSASEAARECGIARRFPAGSDERVPGGQVERLWRAAMRRTGDPRVGLHMAQAYGPGALDILGYVVLSCATVGDVLDRLSRYARILNDGLRIDVERVGETAYCRCTFVASMDNYLARWPDQAVDTTWAGLARERRWLAAEPLAATEVSVRSRISSRPTSRVISRSTQDPQPARARPWPLTAVGGTHGAREPSPAPPSGARRRGAVNGAGSRATRPSR